MESGIPLRAQGSRMESLRICPGIASSVPREEVWRETLAGRPTLCTVARDDVSALPRRGLIGFALERTNVQIRRRPDVCLQHAVHMLERRCVLLDGLGRNTISGDDEMKIAHIGIVSSK